MQESILAQLVKISIAVENKKLHSRACRALSSNQFICHYNEGGKCSPSRKCKLVDISFQQIDWSLDQGDAGNAGSFNKQRASCSGTSIVAVRDFKDSTTYSSFLPLCWTAAVLLIMWLLRAGGTGETLTSNNRGYIEVLMAVGVVDL